MITLRQLRYFEALVRHRHFGRAAEECAVTQPALSMQVAELETLIGVPLIERQARQIQITEAGQEVARRAAAIALSVRELGDLARSKGENLTGTVRLGVIPTVAPYLFPTFHEALQVDYPGLQVVLRETKTDTLVRELREGVLDLLIVATPLDETGLCERTLFTEPFVLVGPAGGANEPVAREAVAAMRLLLLEEGHCLRDQALSFCNAEQARDTLDASSLTTLVQMTAAGLGETVIPAIAAEVECAGAAVTLRPFLPPAPSRTIGLVWRETSPLAPHFEALAARLEAVARRVLELG
ncbi:MAG: hydrogen peroxide-inducible genes activator [Pseudomonadota bacterium]